MGGKGDERGGERVGATERKLGMREEEEDGLNMTLCVCVYHPRTDLPPFLARSFNSVKRQPVWGVRGLAGIHVQVSETVHVYSSAWPVC